MVDKDFIHDALEETILDLDERIEKATNSIKEDTKKEIQRLDNKLDKLITILEKLL